MDERQSCYKNEIRKSTKMIKLKTMHALKLEKVTLKFLLSLQGGHST